jgi:dTDP-N-acetylfucosamine:lipid II N-acetylfucosaminyltransferase
MESINSDRILHVATDEKFINAANYIYERAFPGKNKFIIIVPAANPPLRYVKLEDNFEVAVAGVNLTSRLLAEEERSSLVVLHGLTRYMIDLIVASSHKDKYIWTFWGAEIYNDAFSGEKLYGPKTRLVHQKMSREGFIKKARKAYNKYRFKMEYERCEQIRKKAIGMFKYIARLDPNMDSLLETGVVNPDCTFIPFTYYPLEYLFSENQLGEGVNGSNILLGNSASTTNNHIEILDLLSGTDLGEQKVVMPLSYGDPRYAKYISRYANRRLGDRGRAIRHFLPLNQYHELLRQCGFVIMNHHRPQAVGNILAAIAMGAKVFLNKTPFYHFLKALGCHVYTCSEIEDDVTALKIPLTWEQKEQNRNILYEEISTERVVERLRDSINDNFFENRVRSEDKAVMI